MNKGTAFAPGSIGNVGPGFDVLGLAVDGIGDRVTVELTKRESRVEAITGRDAPVDRRGRLPGEPLVEVHERVQRLVAGRHRGEALLEHLRRRALAPLHRRRDLDRRILHRSPSKAWSGQCSPGGCQGAARGSS